MINLIKKLIPKTIKRRIRISINLPFAYLKLKKLTKGSSKRVIFLIGTPKHGNLGDQAIAYAEIKFLQDTCKNFDVFEIQYGEVDSYLGSLKKLIRTDDLIMLHGGGNMGVEYLNEEELRRKIITNFKEQKIISFPQTIYFDTSDFSRSELEKTKKIYSAHRNLTIIAREEVSFSIMKDVFKNNNVILSPDIVMYLNENKFIEEERKGILVCIRKDNERILNSEFENNLYEKLTKYHNLIFTDTVVNYTINKGQREIELNKIWSSFRHSKLVITDRLHGMVFAAITSTPCIALSNYNQKVKGTYKWIKHLPYIRFIEDENDVYKHLDEILKLDGNKYNNKFAMEYYKEIIKCINT